VVWGLVARLCELEFSSQVVGWGLVPEGGIGFVTRKLILPNIGDNKTYYTLQNVN